LTKFWPKRFFKLCKIQKISDFGGFQSPEVRGESNKNRQSSIFEFQFTAKSREKLLINIWFMVIFWLHLPKDDHLPYGSSPLWLNFEN